MVAIPHPDLAFGNLKGKLNGESDEITIPRELLNSLLKLYISCWDFDEEWYLATYPDIQDAIKQGHFKSGWSHFRAIGYFEGRLGAQPWVDQEWYIRAYPDIAEAVLNGKIASALDHYASTGYKEGRLPCDPGVHARWYAPRYLPTVGISDDAACSEHFVRIGYRQLAVPAPPR